GLEEQFLAGVEHRQIGDAVVPVASAEDLIAMKILAGRSRDLDDVTAILRVRGGHLDLRRIRSTLGLLETALDRADLVSEFERILGARGAGGEPRQEREAS